MKSKKKEFPHYWICDSCAVKKGGKFPIGHACTITQGTCNYCKKDQVVLIPYVDFDWPFIKTSHLRD